MKCTRPILGLDYYKWRTTTIMKKIGWVTIHSMIFAETVNFIQKCIFEGIPQTINNLITFSLDREINERSICKPLLKFKLDSIKANQTTIPRSTVLYNKMPDIFRTDNCN